MSTFASTLMGVAACGSDAGIGSATRPSTNATAGAVSNAAGAESAEAASAGGVSGAETSGVATSRGAAGSGGVGATSPQESTATPAAGGRQLTSVFGSGIASLGSGVAGFDSRVAELNAELADLGAKLGIPITLDEDVVSSLLDGEACSIRTGASGPLTVECEENGGQGNAGNTAGD